MSNSDNKSVFVMVGLPGSGKSTRIDNLRQNFGSDLPFIYSTDALIEEAAEKQGKTYSEVFKDEIGPATEEMDRQLAQAIKNGESVIHDQTNLSRKKREKVLNLFPNDYTKLCVVFEAPNNDDEQKVLDERLANRPGKVISDEVMKDMVNRFEMPVEDEGFSQIIKLNTLVSA